MDNPQETKLVEVTFKFLVHKDLNLNDIHSIIADAEVQIVEAVVRPDPEDEALRHVAIYDFPEFDIWTKLQECDIKIDGEPV